MMKLENINFDILNKWLRRHSFAWASDLDVEEGELKSEFILLLIELERKGSLRNKIVPFALHHIRCVLLTRYLRAKRRSRGFFISIEELKAKGREISYEQEYEGKVSISEFKTFVEEGIKEGRYPEKSKDIISLRLKGYNQREISDILDIPQSNISRWMSKLRREGISWAI